MGLFLTNYTVSNHKPMGLIVQHQNRSLHISKEYNQHKRPSSIRIMYSVQFPCDRLIEKIGPVPVGSGVKIRVWSFLSADQFVKLRSFDNTCESEKIGE